MNVKKLSIAVVLFCILSSFYIIGFKQPNVVSQKLGARFSNRVGVISPTPKPTLTVDQQNTFIANKEKTYLLEDIVSGVRHEQQIKQNEMVNYFTFKRTYPRYDLIDTKTKAEPFQHEWFIVLGKNSYQLETPGKYATITGYEIISKHELDKYEDLGMMGRTALVGEDVSFLVIKSENNIPVAGTLDSNKVPTATMYDGYTWQKIAFLGPMYKSMGMELVPGEGKVDVQLTENTTFDGNLIDYHDISVVGYNEQRLLVDYQNLGNFAQVFLVFSPKTGRVVQKMEFN